MGRTYTKVYYVPDLVTPQSNPGRVVGDFSGLIQDLEAEVFPNTWISAGGNVSASGFPTNLSLVISHDQAGHAEIAKFLQRERDLRKSTNIAVAGKAAIQP